MFRRLLTVVVVAATAAVGGALSLSAASTVPVESSASWIATAFPVPPAVPAAPAAGGAP